MATIPQVTTLNATTVDLVNTIRANASLTYQNSVPEIENETQLPSVGEVLAGYPALANEFVNALITRIALVQIKSTTFHNAYAELKKGQLEFGEVVEETFVSLIKVRAYSAEKAEKREFKRSVPDIKTAFHAINWKVQYPFTIQQDELTTAFLSATGVQDLISSIIDAVYSSAEYDEFLLFKYLMIKAITKGKMKCVSIGETAADMAVAFKGISNKLQFLSTKYNERGVRTSTPIKRQQIFMDSVFDAQYDVDVLASAFNMDKATYMGKRRLMDTWTEFDNERLADIREECDMIEEVTDEELELMKNVVAVLCDSDWFQVYDKITKMTETQVSSGMYWNYFYNVWKIVSTSPFSNSVVFVKGNVPTVTAPTFTVASVSDSDGVKVFNLTHKNDNKLVGGMVKFIQTENLTEKGIAVHPYGSIIVPSKQLSTAIQLKVVVDDKETYDLTLNPDAEVGTVLTATK